MSSTMFTTTVISCLLLQLCYINFVSSHGRLAQPPGRSSAWRYGFNTPINYNDHELYCGGYSTQWGRNGGKCGLCGDPYNVPKPRPHENGGTFGRGVIVKKYRRGQVAEFEVELTANHMGYFEFRLCPHNAPSLPEDENCFDKYLLTTADGGSPKYYVGPGSKFQIKYLLPKTLTCKQCVLQWRYVAGNNWGQCPDGNGKVGCGPQEEFRACSDITITDEEGSADETPGIETPGIKTPVPGIKIPVPGIKIPAPGIKIPVPGIKTPVPGIKTPVIPVIAVIPEDAEDYNDIEINLRSEGAGEEQTPSNTGQIVALVMSFIIAILFLLGILLYYYCKKGTPKEFIKKMSKPSWPTFLVPSLKISSLKKKITSPSPFNITSIVPSPQHLPSGEIPVVPPRRNRPARAVSPSSNLPPNSINDAQTKRNILTISSPTRVSINGVEIKSSEAYSSYAQLYAPCDA